MSRDRAGTEDSVYPSEEYIRILRGRVGWGRGLGFKVAGIGTVEGEVSDRFRIGSIVVAGVLPEDNDNLDAEDVNGPNEGMKEDQRLALGLSVVYDDD